MMNTYEYKILMAPMSVIYTFREFELAMEYGLKRSDYVSVWHGEVEAYSISNALERIFAIHNSDDRPNGKGMRSLSVSDVVVIDNHPYYCNTFGWSEIDSKVWKG